LNFLEAIAVSSDLESPNEGRSIALKNPVGGVYSFTSRFGLSCGIGSNGCVLPRGCALLGSSLNVTFLEGENNVAFTFFFFVEGTGAEGAKAGADAFCVANIACNIGDSSSKYFFS
jgi:hypothetical protein